MTATTTAPASPGAAFNAVMSSAVGAMAAKVDEWTDKLNDVAAGAGTSSGTVDAAADGLAQGGDAKHQAGVRGVQAGLAGKNPVWAAVKGAWTGGGTAVKLAVVAAGICLVLLLLLSPVTLVLLLVAVPIVVVVHKVGSSRT